MDAGLRELLAPITQELPLARTGRRPVEEVEEEEDRHVGGEVADRHGLARSEPDGGLRELVACRQHGQEPTGRGEEEPARSGAPRAASAGPAAARRRTTSRAGGGGSASWRPCRSARRASGRAHLRVGRTGAPLGCSAPTRGRAPAAGGTTASAPAAGAGSAGARSASPAPRTAAAPDHWRLPRCPI